LNIPQQAGQVGKHAWQGQALCVMKVESVPLEPGFGRVKPGQEAQH
jgi:hypothetical protein